MTSVYKNAQGRDTIQRWCRDRLAAWSVPHEATTVATSCGDTHVLSVGEADSTVVFVPGTTMNAAACLPWIEALSQRHRVLTVDVPGQPGLSADERPRRGRSAWYAQMLAEVLDATVDTAIVVGNSLGAAIALACDSPRISGRVLVSPGGVIRLAVSPSLMWRSTAWLLAPGPRTTTRLLERFLAPGQTPPPTEVEWMTLVARYCRSTLAPPPLPSRLLADRARTPCLVSVGEFDRFLSPARLAKPVAARLGVELRVWPGLGHLTTPDRVFEVAELVDELV
ncbi:alpha/beta fold hydrolase [Stackebrandtia nassauensis]|uniref:AB hydrolase-1 domain-containing protein n=1 Tax=Stackebrandtia nassauensis (strain DSM 44728 / CIP 108903 / NRRL B-16338 / NBRC 102104 / LLR-40K-21) TaxID=446470 RepID=D3Q293_STANL|nr:alpha/beta hydrolase [Stackebrandtia nassauensis]ADD43826.1 hypothetical protein Snas_4175 [Stackebrandtia nassauensis DSM 44728]